MYFQAECIIVPVTVVIPAHSINWEKGIIYVSANVVYTGVLSLHDIATADKDRVAVAASHVIFGNIGTIIIALMIMVSTFGCNNGLILST